MPRFPYWRLSGYYFFYFAFVGVFAPFFALYLQSLAFSAWDISLLMTQMQVMRLFGPYFWSAIVDRFGHRLRVIRLTGVVTALLFVVLSLSRSFEAVLAALCAFSFFWVAALPLVETLTFDHLRDETGRYSRVRLWGSIGFIVAVSGAGALLDYLPVSALPWMIGVALSGIAVCGFVVPEAQVAHAHRAPQPIASILRLPRVRALLAACFSMSAAHGAFNIFYSIFLTEHGYSKSLVGALWTTGVLAEIAVFFAMPRLMRCFGLRRVMLLCFVAAAFRFSAIGLCVDHLPVLVAAQLLHGLTFGAMHAAAIAAVNRWFPGNTRARGQALYSSLTFGAGGLVGGLASGWAWDQFGGGTAFALGSLFALLGLFAVGGWVFDDRVGEKRVQNVVSPANDS